MKRQIAVVTMVQDDKLHMSLVQEHLEQELVAIDPRLPPFGKNITFDQDRRGDHVFYGDLELNPGAMWWRWMPGIIAEDAIRPGVVVDWCRDYSMRSVVRHADSLSDMFPRAAHLSHPVAMQAAMAKPWQMRHARRLGMQLPRTCQSSDPIRARAFVDEELRLNGRCVRKIMVGRPPVHPELGPLVSPTDIITCDNVNDFDWPTLPYAPQIFQDLVPGDDVTVGVIDRQVFPVLVTSPVDESVTGFRDFRQAGMSTPGEIACEPIRISAADARRCIRLVRRQGLRCARLDFIRRPDGSLVFLESNSAGAFAFLETYAGHPIGKAFAKSLTAPSWHNKIPYF